MFSLFIPSLSALIFICSADSSPETYKTLPSPFILFDSCKIKVDFPIPGSPPSKVKEPFTRPPPSTLSNSSKPVDILVDKPFSTLVKGVGSTSFLIFDLPILLVIAFSS